MKYTGSLIIDNDDTMSPIHRYHQLLECLCSFKKDNGLTRYYTVIDNDDQHVRFAWPAGKIVIQWYNNHFMLEYEGLTQEDYRGLRKSFVRYWSKNSQSTKLLRSKLKLG